MPRYCLIIVAILLAAASLAYFYMARTRPSAAPGFAQSHDLASARADDAYWQPLLKRLGDADSAVRETAQKELDNTTWRDLPALKSLADAATDAEAKSRLSSRITAIEEDLAVNPPPISLDLKDAPISELPAVFSKLLNCNIEGAAKPIASSARYTLHATDTPFWEVFQKLSRQSSLMFDDTWVHMRLVSAIGETWTNGVIAGPVAIFPQPILRDPSDAANQTLLWPSIIGIDPRIRMDQHLRPRFTQIIDDKGNSLLEPMHLIDELPLNVIGFSGTIQYLTAALVMPQNKGTRIASARGEVRYQAILKQEELTVTDLDGKVGQAFDIGGATVQLTRFVAAPAEKDIQVTIKVTLVKPPPQSSATDPLAENYDPEVTFYLTDANGKSVTAGSMEPRAPGFGLGMTDAFTQPFKLRFVVATKTKSVIVPFELKDIPLP